MVFGVVVVDVHREQDGGGEGCDRQGGESGDDKDVAETDAVVDGGGTRRVAERGREDVAARRAEGRTTNV